MLRISCLLPLFFLLGLFSSCENAAPETEKPVTEVTNKEEEKAPKKVDRKMLTKEEQENLTPSEVIRALQEGNLRFVNNDLTERDHSAHVRQSVKGQYPKAVVLSCIDSRVPVEDVFDRGIGDLFVARVAGNFVNTDMLGSLEYSCKVAGSKLIVVLGHEHCGAVKSAIDEVKMGNITALLEKITPSVQAVEYAGDRTSKNQEFVHLVCEHNVERTLQDIRVGSPILKELEEQGKIKIVGALYDMDTGAVSFLPEEGRDS